MKAVAEGFISLNMEKIASVKLGRALRSSPIPRVPTMDNLIPFVERDR
jgi:cell division septal protein FtsQ